MVPTESIRTPRLVLEPLRVAHADEMAAVLADERLHEFIGGSPLTADELRVRYERLVAGSPDAGTGWHNWVIRLVEVGRLVGTVQATTTDEGRHAEIAWVVGTAWQGRGIATEAARGLADRLVAQGAEAIVAHVHPDHRASAAVARAVGLTPTAQVDDGEVLWRRDVVRPRRRAR